MSLSETDFADVTYEQIFGGIYKSRNWKWAAVTISLLVISVDIFRFKAWRYLQMRTRLEVKKKNGFIKLTSGLNFCLWQLMRSFTPSNQEN